MRKFTCCPLAVSLVVGMGISSTSLVTHAALQLEEVVVTARKREENMQETPVAVTAFTGDMMERMGVTEFENLDMSNPNVKITAGGPTGVVGTTVAIRGNIQSATTVQIDPAVGTYVDGFIMSHPFALDGAMVDVDSVQTLKGPQGTLFGRNTTGGAFLVNTRNPDLDADTSGYLKIGFGELGTENYTTALNLSLNDNVALRILAHKASRDGFVTLPGIGERGDKETEVYRAKLLWQLNDATSVLVNAENTTTSGTAALHLGSHPNNLDYDNAVNNPAIFPLSGTNDYSQADMKSYGVTITHELDDSEIKLLVGHREYDVAQNFSLPPLLGYGPQDKPDNDQTSLELQYNATLFSGDLDLTSGLFYFEETTHELQETFLYSGYQVASRYLTTDVKSKSAYVQATYHISDQLNLTLGGRYTDDQKDAILESGVTAGIANRIIQNPYENHQKEFNYLITLDYSPTDNMMLYATTSSGYRFGGPGVDVDQNRPVVGGVGYPTSFEAEYITNYEAGIKSDLLDGQLRINAAVFMQDYQDYQYTSVEDRGGAIPVRVIQNADADIHGGEIEATLLLPSDFTLAATYGYTKGEITANDAYNNGDTLPNIPEKTWSLSLSKFLAVGEGELNLSATYSWRDEFFTALDIANTVVDEQPESTVEDLGLLNISATYTQDNWVVAGYINNATNEEYYRHITYASSGVINVGHVGVSRVAGVNVTYHF